MPCFRLPLLRTLSALLLFLASTSLAHKTIAQATAGDASLRDELRQMIGEARDRVFPALVSIRVVTAEYRGGREIKGQGVGSGTIISPRGHVLTNQHVTNHGQKFILTLSDKREVEAELVGDDPLTDLALLKLDLEKLEDGPPLAVAPFGDSDALEIGDYVMAMGSPFSLSRSVSLGIVSNTERVFAAGFGSDDLDEMEIDGQRTGLFTRWIQHDALINPGNSGGPLVNLLGEVVGINELGGGGVGFAIPANLALEVVDSLKRHGEVPRSSIGASFKPIRNIGLDDGALISSVIVDGPAEHAGLKAGDVLLELYGEPVSVRFPEQVPLLLGRVAALPIGEEIELRFRRGNARRGDEIRTATVVTERLAQDVGEEAAFPAWGLTAQELTPKMARDLGLETSRGVIVSGTRGSGPAQTAEPALELGDLLRSIEGREISALGDLLTVYEDFHAEGEPPEELVVELERRGTSQMTLLEPRAETLEDSPRELPKAWIGIATQPLLPRLAERLGLKEDRGFRVTRVYPESEATGAGLEVGDVVVGLDGEPLGPRGLEDSALLSRRVRSKNIGDTVRLTVLRDGELRELPVVLERTRLTPQEARRHRDRDFEITVRELTFFDRDSQRWGEEVDGVLVERVEGSGWADLGGLRPMDVILRLGETDVRGIQSFRRALREVKSSRPEHVVAVVLRGGRTHFHDLEPDWITRNDDD